MAIKFESGGTAPFVSYTPLNFNTASNYDSSDIEDTRKTKSSDSKESEKLTDKDLLMAIKDLDVLPSDSAKLFNQMVDFIRMQEMGFIDPSMLAIQFIRAQQEIKTAIYRQKNYDNALDTLKENKGQNSQAISPDGRIVGVNLQNEIKLFNIGEDTGEYRPITNFELSQLRANYYANNDYLTQIINNGIGFEKIDSLIHQYINSLRKDTISVQTDEVHAGFDTLKELSEQGLTIDEAIGNKFLTENQAKQAQEALIYLKEALPENAQNLLRYRASQLKKSDGTTLSEDDILILMLNSRISSKQILSDQNKSGKSRSGSGSEKVGADDFSSDQYTNISRGQGQTSTGIFQLRDSDGFSVDVKGKAYPYLFDQNGNVIETTTLSKALQKGIGTMSKGGNWAITFGDQILDANAKSNILFESDGSGIRVILPTKQQDGKIVPDLDIAKENKELISSISESNYENPFDDPIVQQKMKESDLFLDATGNLDYSKFGVYLVFNAKSDSDTINNSEWVEFYDPDDKDKSRFEKYIQEENPDYEFDSYDTFLGIPNPFDLFDNYHKMVKGSVFVPITDNLLATGTGTKKNYKESTQHELETQRQIQEFKRKYSLNQTENINDKLDGK